jgi:23S rRNA (uridine2552-2'-O)-methyltransferase
VLSDVAPKLTGVRDADEARCAEVVDAVIDALPRLLKPGGRAVVKLFMDPSYREHRRRLESCFADVKTTRPDASRHGSSELYFVGSAFRAPSTPVDKL